VRIDWTPALALPDVLAAAASSPRWRASTSEPLSWLERSRGWTPLDARVRVSSVVRLVESLGGRELYGETPHVPLRELIQNASDAVRARRVVERRADDWGDIVVRLRTGDREVTGYPALALRRPAP
jgi:hypothetical protein